MSWLVDKSAYVRLATTREPARWVERIDRGLVHVATVTRLEIGYSMRSWRDLQREVEEVLGRLVGVHIPPRAEDRAVEVQGLLTQRGHHRAPSIPDLLIAATAEVLDLVVLHADKDFELIADVTGQPLERIVVDQ